VRSHHHHTLTHRFWHRAASVSMWESCDEREG